MYTLYINFEGVTLTPCGTPDARLNCSNLVTQEAQFPPFLDGNPNRDGFIATILYSARKGLAPYSIEVVTTRPATGSYYMMVFGSTSAAIGLQAGFFGIAPFQCTPENRNNVSITFDSGQMPTTFEYANSVLSDMAMLVGISTTTVNDDCACRGAGGCTIDPNKLCTYGSDVAVNPDPTFSCERTTQDEPAMMQAALGCR